VRKLILIKHSRPLVDPARPSHRWILSYEGREKCAALAEAVRRHDPKVIIASEEPKASETGRLVAEALRLPFATASDLHEHDRTNVPHMRSREFISYMALFFQRPAERVLGRESADQAANRIGAAVEAVLAQHPDGNIAVVTHGTVLALLAERRAGENGFAIWRKMGLPSMLVFELPEWRMTERLDTI
jgi:broad specificity phosphatase PhoE